MLIAYFVWDLGEHNYLTDISTSGGDAGGGNVEVTMSYQNDFSEAVFARHSSVIDLSNRLQWPILGGKMSKRRSQKHQNNQI